MDEEEKIYPVIRVHIHQIDIPKHIKDNQQFSLSSSISPPPINVKTKNEGPSFKMSEFESISWSFEYTLNTEFQFPYWIIDISLTSYSSIFFSEVYNCKLNISELLSNNNRHVDKFWIDMVDSSSNFRKTGIRIEVSLKSTLSIEYYGRYVYNLRNSFDLDISMDDIYFFIKKNYPLIHNFFEKLETSKNVLNYFTSLLPSSLPKIQSNQSSNRKKEIKINSNSLTYDWAIINNDDNNNNDNNDDDNLVSFGLKIDDLPDDILLDIFDLCDEKTKGNILFVSKRWNYLLTELIKSPSLSDLIYSFYHPDKNDAISLSSISKLINNKRNFNELIEYSKSISQYIYEKDNDILLFMYIFLWYIDYLEIFIEIQYRWSSISSLRINLLSINPEYSSDSFGDYFNILLKDNNWIHNHILSTCCNIMKKKQIKNGKQMKLFIRICIYALSIVNASKEKSFMTKNYRYVLNKLRDDYKDYVSLNDWKIFYDSYHRWGGL